MSKQPQQPVRIGILGAGTFARKAHVPSLLSQPERFTIVAVCSRSAASAEKLAAMVSNHPVTEQTVTGQTVTVYTDTALMLAHEGLDAVDIVLPIHLLADGVRTVLKAGKHVVSEKPIAPTVKEAKDLLYQKSRHHPDQVWMVAENWRYEPAFDAAAKAIAAGEIGRPLLFDWAMHLPVATDNPYYRTEWRRANRFPGGYLMDGGVHHVAALRQIVGEVAEVSAFASNQRGDLPPADSLTATLHMANSLTGTYSVTYAAGSSLHDNSLHVVGERGSLRVYAGWLKVDGIHGLREERFPGHTSVGRELAAFAQAITEGSPHRNMPMEAFQDLAVMEALLDAARTGKRVPVTSVLSTMK